jgi:hypothetical protein
MTRKTQTLKKVKSQKKSKSQLRKTRKVRKHKVGGVHKVPKGISDYVSKIYSVGDKPPGNFLSRTPLTAKQVRLMRAGKR